MASTHEDIGNLTKSCDSYVQFAIICRMHRYMNAYFTVTCLGAALSSLAILIGPIATWVLFRKTRNFHNYVSLNQCITATFFAVIMCVQSGVSYFFINKIYNIIVSGDIEKMEKLSKAYASGNVVVHDATWIEALSSYTLLCLYCWNTASAILCYGKIVKVFTRNIQQKYLITNLLCYGAPLPIFLINSDFLPKSFFTDVTKLVKVVTVLSSIVLLTAVNSGLYLCIAIAICKGKRPGNGETIRTITTALVIFTIFGLWFCIVFTVIWCHFAIRTNKQFGDTSGAIKIFLSIHCLMVSTHPIVISIFHAIGSKRNRELWMKYFCNKQNSTPELGAKV